MRPVSSRASTRVSAAHVSTTSKWVRASRAPRPPDRAALGGTVVAPERSVDRSRARAGAALDEGQVGGARPRAPDHRRPGPAWASSVRATIIRPEVSLSSRWTMPGRTGSEPPPRRSPSASTRVLPRWPGAAWTTRPGRLVDHREPLVGVDDLRLGHGAHAGAARARRRERPRARAARPPERDRDVGHVERGPQGRVDEVGDGVDADPVDQVARGRLRPGAPRRARGPGAPARSRTRPASRPARSG